MFETNPLKLDEWDVRFIHLTKNGNHPVKKYLELWAERCDVSPTLREIPQYMFAHFLELFLKINADDAFRQNFTLQEIFKHGDPKSMFYDTNLNYWENMLMNLAGQFAITKVSKLPFYREKITELGLFLPSAN